jgi:hypothetical protein
MSTKTRAFAKLLFVVAIMVTFALVACEGSQNQNRQEREKVNEQQGQYAIGQPVPAYDFSLERNLLIKRLAIRLRYDRG